MLELIFAGTFTSVSLLIYACICLAMRNHFVISVRLHELGEDDKGGSDEVFNLPLTQRFLTPALKHVSRFMVSITPNELLASLEKRIVAAGNPFGWSMSGWLNLMAGMVVGLPVVTIGFAFLNAKGSGNLLLVAAAQICAGLLMPGFYLEQKTKQRQKTITNSLPDILDLLTVSVEAGLSFDGALSKVIEKFPGDLAMEFSKVLQNMKVGKSKREALKGMCERVNVPDVTTFVNAIIQAEQFGVGIGNVLRIQSEQIRMKRKQRAQEQAMKAPVKMLIPMALFIFPVIFSVLLGPIAVKMINAFSK